MESVLMSEIVEHAGWIGSICLALCGVPQAVDSLLRGHSRGLNAGFLVLWFLGEVCTLLYIVPKQDIPLILNYSINLMCLLVILRYRFWPRVNWEQQITPIRRVK